ncbi:MAG TPA: FG-GAP-like repeat-containing protein [Cyclobacteriaceae bacterium]
MKKIIYLISLSLVVLSFNSCWRTSCHEEMIALLKYTKQKTSVPENTFSSLAKLPFMDSLLAIPHSTPNQIAYCKYLKANILLELGRESEAITLFEDILSQTNASQQTMVRRDLGIAYLRQGERSNCISNHAAESCLLPVRGMGIHRDAMGSSKAIELYLKLLKENPDDIESKWLLNLAYMTLGDYPSKVPAAYLLPGLEGDTTVKVIPFQDIAASLRLDVNNMAGGSITEDFDNDGYLDIVTSGMDLADEMHYFKNNTDGTFTDLSQQSGLKSMHGGLNIMQTDYNNDGFKDIFVLRGAWKGKYGEEPNSLLKNNGDGTFTDVTTISGLLSFHPTQTATWNDFNNDGWVDVFIGNESGFSMEDKLHPSELYINNQDGTFREIAAIAKCDYSLFVKGVTSGDYDNDGWKDLFLSTMNGRRILFKNKGIKDKEIEFEDVTSSAGLTNESGNSFPTWFWDYDNDGWLDIFACDYTFKKSLAFYAAAEKLNRPEGNPEKMLLYHNNHDGTFTNVAKEIGLDKVAFAMGSNFGDIDNDGYLDMYLGTGNPQYQSLIPNKMFKNLGGKKFADVTTSARVGHLQKGHGVSFADMDNDGDQDIYIEMGGAYSGDSYQNSFFLNPGQNNNNWICIKLEGTTTNKAAIGTRVRISFKENGIIRNVYRDVNSGGSFGSSPLRREIGIGQADNIEDIEIQWHGTNTIQRFKNIKPNRFIKITEGKEVIEEINLKKINWVLPEQLCLPIAMNFNRIN